LKKPNFLKLLKQEELKSLDFNKAEYNYFIENCNFTDRQKEILDLRRNGSSIISISLKLYLSERTINREIKKIKNKILKVI
jgi:DNA-binding NarL/FixJ family response regulator